jgi:hypothetical protein
MNVETASFGSALERSDRALVGPYYDVWCAARAESEHAHRLIGAVDDLVGTRLTDEERDHLPFP